MHQIVPKGAGVDFIQGKEEMFFIKRFPNSQNIPILNIAILEKVTREAIFKFKGSLMIDKNSLQVEQIYDHLIEFEDGFGDFAKFGDSIKATPEITNFIDDCTDH